MKISIEEKSGFCYGVDRVISMAVSILEKGEVLYCLGQVVHNEMEVKRLEDKGMITITREMLPDLHDCKLLIRAHGEPPSTYGIARKNNIELIDGTCPIVRKIQTSILEKYSEKNSIIVIFGKPDHPEVIGLSGQAPERSFVVRTIKDLENLPSGPLIHLYSQTTMDTGEFMEIIEILKEKQQLSGGRLVVHNTICNHVSHRKPGLIRFASGNEVIIFVSGKKSSNGKVLFEACLTVNARSYKVSHPEELQASWFKGVRSTGIAGATSTPAWQIREVEKKIREMVGDSQ